MYLWSSQFYAIFVANDHTSFYLPLPHDGNVDAIGHAHSYKWDPTTHYGWCTLTIIRNSHILQSDYDNAYEIQTSIRHIWLFYLKLKIKVHFVRTKCIYKSVWCTHYCVLLTCTLTTEFNSTDTETAPAVAHTYAAPICLTKQQSY